MGKERKGEKDRERVEDREKVRKGKEEKERESQRCRGIEREMEGEIDGGRVVCCTVRNNQEEKTLCHRQAAMCRNLTKEI